jgi:hypothetical protein
MTDRKSQEGSRTADQDLKDEISRLQRRINDLEDELNVGKGAHRARTDHDASRTRRRVDHTIGDAGELVYRTNYEIGRIARGLTLAAVEEIKGVGRFAEAFADEVLRRRGESVPYSRVSEEVADGRRARAQRATYTSEEADIVDETNEDISGSTPTEDVPRRRYHSAGDSVLATVVNIPGDMIAGVLAGFDAVSDVPTRAADRFSDTIRESSAEPRSDRSVRHEPEDRRQTGIGRSGIKEESIDPSSGRAEA